MPASGGCIKACGGVEGREGDGRPQGVRKASISLQAFKYSFTHMHRRSQAQRQLSPRTVCASQGGAVHLISPRHAQQAAFASQGGAVHLISSSHAQHASFVRTTIS